MDYLELMKLNKPYASCDLDMPNEYQITSKKLCFEYNHTAPDETEKRRGFSKNYSVQATITQ